MQELKARKSAILYKVASYLILTCKIIKGFARCYLGLVFIKKGQEKV